MIEYKNIPKPTKNRHCPDCVYCRDITGVGSKVWACHYMLDTGEKRGLPPAECYGQPGTPYKSRIWQKRKEEEKMQKLRKDLIAVREAAGLSQNAFGLLAGVTSGTVWRIEAGKNIRPDGLQAIKRAMQKLKSRGGGK